jgi:predicted aldo/keto reductase-like oxidoreductase
MAGGFLDKERNQPVNCQAALKWVLQDPNVHTTIPGITSFDQLTENVGVMKNLEMTEEEKKFIEEARLLSGLYCDQCGQCVADCRKHLPVNEIMRAYMYAYGYRQTENAHAVLRERHIETGACKDCDSCSVMCHKGFNIKERIADVSRLADIPGEFLV